jgi:hypothetical protein
VTQTLAQVGHWRTGSASDRSDSDRPVKSFESQTGQRPIELEKVRREAETKTFEGFDPGSERTLAAWIRHASRGNPSNGGTGVRGSKAWVPTLKFGIAIRDGG